MAYCTSRGDMEAWHVRFIPANEAGSQSRTPKSIVTLDRSELHADAAIERIGPAAPQRDGEADEAPQQRVLVTAVEPRKSSLPIEHRDDEHFHRGGGGEEAREKADDERDTAGELDDQRRPDPGQRRIESLLHEGAEIGRRSACDLAPAMHQEVPAHCDAHDRPGERDGEIVERLEAGKQQLGFVSDFGIDARHVFSSLIELSSLYVCRLDTAHQSCSTPHALKGQSSRKSIACPGRSAAPQGRSRPSSRAIVMRCRPRTVPVCGGPGCASRCTASGTRTAVAPWRESHRRRQSAPRRSTAN